MPLRTILAASAAAFSLGIAPPLRADPHPGSPAPIFAAADLHGRVHRSQELSTGPTLVIVCTSADAQRAANAWMRRARMQAPHGGVRVVTLVALRLPFFVTEGMVRGRAQPQVPSISWGDTWIDIHGDLQRALGVADGSPMPYVFTVDQAGHILASVHVPVEHPSASAIFASLDPTQRTVVDRREPGI